MKMSQASDLVTNIIQLYFIWQENVKKPSKDQYVFSFYYLFPRFLLPARVRFSVDNHSKLRSNPTRWYCILLMNGVLCHDIYCQ